MEDEHSLVLDVNAAYDTDSWSATKKSSSSSSSSPSSSAQRAFFGVYDGNTPPPPAPSPLRRTCVAGLIEMRCGD
jgi:hypothetical protein